MVKLHFVVGVDLDGKRGDATWREQAGIPGLVGGNMRCCRA